MEACRLGSGGIWSVAVAIALTELEWVVKNRLARSRWYHRTWKRDGHWHSLEVKLLPRYA